MQITVCHGARIKVHYITPVPNGEKRIPPQKAGGCRATRSHSGFQVQLGGMYPFCRLGSGGFAVGGKLPAYLLQVRKRINTEAFVLRLDYGDGDTVLEGA